MIFLLIKDTCENPNKYCESNLIEHCAKCTVGGSPCTECSPNKYLNPVDGLSCSYECPLGYCG